MIHNTLHISNAGKNLLLCVLYDIVSVKLYSKEKESLSTFTSSDMQIN